ncbi:gfo/Idh/MocA family oxidoreductase [Streptomyces venezuelae]|uniref:Gfo/Idh/MocA family oxidoreductase n=1 Tax=Streptomyces venezuelae TaxID=54571 RepID=A0A5P2CRP8_STRVZ|nr:Gfo/Idh/MocA family oxidoreductase [Streptomyces venezuelae]QES45063.1 gfo/Idh/MocA family oxidoreductase [Streptomyces venezuelae]
MRSLHIGLLGAGGIARAHLPGWLALGARVSVYTVDGSAEKLASEYAERGHDVRAVDDLGTLLADAGAVDICTPTPTHKELALAAVAAGHHVVCEKPLALTARDAEEIGAAADAAGVRLHPAHVVRYFPAYAALHEAVTRGDLGEPAVLRFTRGGARPQWAPWFGDPAQSGGVIMDLMVHDIDIARWLAGDVVRVHARTRGVEHATGAPPEVVTASAVLTHASGAVSHVNGLWGLPDQQFRTTFRVAGADGLLHHDSTAVPGFRITAQGVRAANEGIPTSPMTESPFLTELREFAASWQDGGPEPRVSTRDGIEAVRIAEAAVESSRTGRVIEMSRTTETTEEATR